MACVARTVSIYHEDIGESMTYSEKTDGIVDFLAGGSAVTEI
jgi:hypothetical protein